MVQNCLVSEEDTKSELAKQVNKIMKTMDASPSNEVTQRMPYGFSSKSKASENFIKPAEVKSTLNVPSTSERKRILFSSRESS